MSKGQPAIDRLEMVVQGAPEGALSLGLWDRIMKWQQNEVHPLQPSPRGMMRLRSEVSPISRRMGCKCLEVLFPYCLTDILGIIKYQS